MGAVEYGEDAALRQVRASCPWVLVLVRRLVGVAAVHIPGMVAGVRWMAWPRPTRRHRWAGPGDQPHDRGPSQPPLRGTVRVRVLRRRRTVGQCLPGPGAPYLCAGTGGGVATGAHRLSGLRSPLLRDPCARTQ